MKFTSHLVLVGVALSLSGAAWAQTATPAQIFELRNKCQILSQELGNRQTNGSWSFWTQTVTSSSWTQTVTSNYSLKTQHCYAQIQLSPADDANLPASQYKFSLSLYDAQTKELLANWTKSIDQNTDALLMDGQIYDRFFEGRRFGLGEANNCMRNLMNPER